MSTHKAMSFDVLSKKDKKKLFGTRWLGLSDFDEDNKQSAYFAY